MSKVDGGNTWSTHSYSNTADNDWGTWQSDYAQTWRTGSNTFADPNITVTPSNGTITITQPNPAVYPPVTTLVSVPTGCVICGDEDADRLCDTCGAVLRKIVKAFGEREFLALKEEIEAMEDE